MYDQVAREDTKNDGKPVRRFRFRGLQITLLEDDITWQVADVIVNAANETLVGEDGVDGAIHIAAGSELQKECDKTGYCAVTDVVVTSAYNLPAKHVFHTVGPQWNESNRIVADLLTLTYYNNLQKAESMRLQSIVFPSISTGQYGVPTHIGAKSFADALIRFAANDKPKFLKDIRMVTYYDLCFDERSDAYQQYALHLSDLVSKRRVFRLSRSRL